MSEYLISYSYGPKDQSEVLSFSYSVNEGIELDKNDQIVYLAVLDNLRSHGIELPEAITVKPGSNSFQRHFSGTQVHEITKCILLGG